MSDDEHYLSSFLEERLPQLGLDYETYGPYVIGVVADDNDESDLGDVMELLRASSESHGDDEEAWKEFEKQVREKQQQELKSLHEKEHEALELKKRQEHDRLQKEIDLAKKQQEEMEAAHHAEKELDAAKRALVERYAYDESEEYDHDGNVKTKQSESNDAPVTNKQAAAQAHQEEARKQRQSHTTSKREEREKTKEAKEAKKNLKEERRKRAQKGERRR